MAGNIRFFEIVYFLLLWLSMSTDKPAHYDTPVRTLFDIIDFNHSGRISRREIAALAKAVRVDIDIDELLRMADRNGNDKLEFEEFEAALMMRVGKSRHEERGIGGSSKKLGDTALLLSSAGLSTGSSLDDMFLELVGQHNCKGLSVPVAVLEQSLISTLKMDPLKVKEVLESYRGIWDWRRNTRAKADEGKGKAKTSLSRTRDAPPLRPSVLLRMKSEAEIDQIDDSWLNDQDIGDKEAWFNFGDFTDLIRGFGDDSVMQAS